MGKPTIPNSSTDSSTLHVNRTFDWQSPFRSAWALHVQPCLRSMQCSAITHGDTHVSKRVNVASNSSHNLNSVPIHSPRRDVMIGNTLSKASPRRNVCDHAHSPVYTPRLKKKNNNRADVRSVEISCNTNSRSMILVFSVYQRNGGPKV